MLFLCCPNWQHLYFIPLEQIFIRQYLSLDKSSPLFPANENLARQMKRKSSTNFSFSKIDFVSESGTIFHETIYILDSQLY